MKTIKANNYESVKNAFSEMGADNFVDRVPSAISILDKGYFHIVLIKIIANQNGLSNDLEINMIKTSQIGFERIEKNFEGRYQKLFILHNPLEEMEDVKEIVEVAAKSTGVSEEVQRRINDALAKQREELSLPTQNANTNDEDLSEFVGKQMIDITGLFNSDATNKELKNFAAENGLVLANVKNKEEIKKSLVDAVNEYNAKIEKANLK